MKGSLCRLAETSFLWRDTAMRIRERFNPRAPCGARQLPGGELDRGVKFQPTRPLAGRDGVRLIRRGRGIENFNPRAPCGARRASHLACRGLSNFNPRAPCGARRASLRGGALSRRFQPTRPLRGATENGIYRDMTAEISTHAPLAGRDKWSAAFSLSV